MKNLLNMLHVNMFSWQQQVSLYKYSFLDNKCRRNCLLISIWACCNPKSYSPDVDITELFQHCPESHMYELGVRRFEQCWKRNKSTSYFFSTCLVYKLILKDKSSTGTDCRDLSSSATSLQFYLADLKILFSKYFFGQEILKINQKLFYKNILKILWSFCVHFPWTDILRNYDCIFPLYM